MKIRHIVPLAAALLLLAPIAWAQPASPPRDPSLRTISVTGTAEMHVPPDHVLLSFTIVVDDKNIDKARAMSDERAKKLLALFRQLGIEDKDVQSDYLNIAPRYAERPGLISSSSEFTGYFVTKRINVVLRDLSKYEPLIAEAMKAGATGVNQGEFRTGKLREQRDQARALATQAALEKAKAIAGQLGATVGKPFSISEEVVYPASPVNRIQDQNSSGGGAGVVDTLAPGEVIVRAKIDVVFLLE